MQIGMVLIGEVDGDEFGYSVSMNDVGNIVAVGAIHNDESGDSSGHVRVFEDINGEWTRVVLFFFVIFDQIQGGTVVGGIF